MVCCSLALSPCLLSVCSRSVHTSKLQTRSEARMIRSSVRTSILHVCTCVCCYCCCRLLVCVLFFSLCPWTSWIVTYSNSTLYVRVRNRMHENRLIKMSSYNTPVRIVPPYIPASNEPSTALHQQSSLVCTDRLRHWRT